MTLKNQVIALTCFILKISSHCLGFSSYPIEYRSLQCIGGMNVCIFIRILLAKEKYVQILLLYLLYRDDFTFENHLISE